MYDVAPELRYDPDDDDSHPPRSPSGVLRILTSAITSIHGLHNPADAYEGICRALAESGLVAAVLARRDHSGRHALLAHRLGVTSLASSLMLSALDGEDSAATFFPSGKHPLCQVIPAEGALTFPSVAVRIPNAAGGVSIIVSLFAPDIGPEHLAAADAFAEMLGLTLARMDTEQRLRELNARIDQRVRERTADLSALHELSLALSTTATGEEVARLAASSMTRMFPGDATAALICVDGHHASAVVMRGVLAPAFEPTMAVRLHDGLLALAGGAHRACRVDPVVTLTPDDATNPASGPAVLIADSDLQSVIEAPVLADGRVIGLLLIASQRRVVYRPDQVELLYTVANRLAAAVERLTQRWDVERQRLATLMEGLADGMVLLDPAGQVLTGNSAGRALFESLDLGPSSAAGPDAITVLVADALAGNGRGRTEIIPSADPERRISVTAVPVTDVSGVRAVALTLRDTTDEARMRERLFQSEKLASLGQVVSGVAHELNNPLTGIMGFAQLLMARRLEGDAQRDAEMIFTEADRASKLVHQLLSFARRRRPEKVAVDLNALIERVLVLQQYELLAHNITVRRLPARDLPPCLADPQQIQQVLLNLLVNARQAIAATECGGAIEIATSAAGGHVRVTITDDGPGIPAEHQRRIFDPFFSTKPAGEGTGLGLTISYGIVEEHQGTITVDSGPEGGTTFTIELPATPLSPAEPANSRIFPMPGELGRTVLVVEDEPSIRNLLTAVLALDGYNVESVGQGAEALERILHSRFDAVVADVRLPGMDGMEFYRRVREHDPGLARRIILVSGDTVSRELHEFVVATSLPFLPKPFKIEDLRELVAAVLKDEP